MDTPRQVIEEILNLAVWAPSGDNCQPWRFEATDNKINIFNVPHKDQALYNFRQSGSLVAHGALVENILIIIFWLDIHVNSFVIIPRAVNGLDLQAIL